MKKIDPTQYSLFPRVDLREGKSKEIYKGADDILSRIKRGKMNS